LFEKVVIIGVGLIGSSLAHNIRDQGLAKTVVGVSRSADNRAKILELGLADSVTDDAAAAVAGADCVLLCTAVGAYGPLSASIGPHLAPGCIVSDVGSTKGSVINDIQPHMPEHVHFIPAHPIAGTEQSGPTAGFASLFRDRWVILTPLPGTPTEPVQKIAALWRACGAMIDEMDAGHHDRVLAMTSHLPHLIAYTIVDTATQLEDDMKTEVIKFSASGFRDFTRIAGSDPTMWRDVFLNNKDAVLDLLQRFQEDLVNMQRAIRRGDGEFLFDRFTETRSIRQSIVDARQAGQFIPTEGD
jgi:cyclohexadieny/prephenate dehydrogenase